VKHRKGQSKLLEAREGIEPPYEALQAPA
jgi:hypothetical protein